MHNTDLNRLWRNIFMTVSSVCISLLGNWAWDKWYICFYFLIILTTLVFLVAVRKIVNTLLRVCRGGVITLSEVAQGLVLSLRMNTQHSFQISSSHLPVLFFQVWLASPAPPHPFLLSGRAGMYFNESVAGKRAESKMGFQIKKNKLIRWVKEFLFLN